MKIESPKNPNYCATVVDLKTFIDLPNCNNVKHTLVFGNLLIVSKDLIEGSRGIFFPVETQLSAEFLSANNLYRKPEWGNVDPLKTGFFEQHGRIKCLRFRGHKSEGFFVPLESLSYLGLNLTNLSPGDSFDALDGHQICQKYVIKAIRGQNSKTQAKKASLKDQIVDNQFRFHFDTENLRRNADKIKVYDIISISDKWHGTSVIISKLLTKKNLNWFQRQVNKVLPLETTEYSLVYSSRKVIKAINGISQPGNSYYSSDIWGDVAKEVEELIPTGYTLYGEIVGYTKEGKPIQGGYHYGCKFNSLGWPQHKFLVYRITSTNSQGKVIELSWPQMKEFTTKYGLTMVKEIYYGSVWNLWIQEHPEQSECNPEEFVKLLEKLYVRDQMCPENNLEVPAEGIVVRIDHLETCESYKLKNFKFLKKESDDLDKGQIDLESSQEEEISDES